jgi:cell division protease FtsH
VERGLTEYDEKLDLKPEQERLMAVHESGHFIVSLCCPHHPPPERITIRSEMPWAPAYVGFKKDEYRRLGFTRNEFLDDLCVLMGGMEAERLLLGDVSTGAGGNDPRSDLGRGTQIAQAMVEIFGMGGQTTGVRVYRDQKGEREILSGSMAEAIDRAVNSLLNEAQARAASILRDHKEDLLRLRDMVLAKKIMDRDEVQLFIDDFRRRHPATGDVAPRK